MTRNNSTKSENLPVSSTQLNAHTQDHTHIWTGQGSHQRGTWWGAGSGALTVCQGCTTCMAAHTRGCSSTSSSSSATLWGKGASEEEGVHNYKEWNQSGPNPQSSAPASWDSPGPVGWGQPLSIGEAFAHTRLWLWPALPPPTEVTVASMTWEGVTLPSLLSSSSAPSLWAHRLHRDRSTQGHPYKLGQVTFIT